MSIARIGVVAGLRAELDALLPGMPRSPCDPLRERGSGLAVDRLGHAGKTLFLACGGIGKVAPATAAATLHARCGVELLLVIGTAGKVAAIEGELFLLTEAAQVDYGAWRPDGLVRYTAGEWPIGPAALAWFRALDVPGCDLPTARIATSDLFVECPAHAAALVRALDIQLIDMETAAVAQAAAMLGIPWLAIKATTDGADGDSATSFQANLARAARSAAKAAERVMRSL